MEEVSTRFTIRGCVKGKFLGFVLFFSSHDGGFVQAAWDTDVVLLYPLIHGLTCTLCLTVMSVSRS